MFDSAPVAAPVTRRRFQCTSPPTPPCGKERSSSSSSAKPSMCVAQWKGGLKTGMGTLDGDLNWGLGLSCRRRWNVVSYKMATKS